MKTSQQIEDLYPLSPVQHGMLFHCLLAPEVGVYFVQKSCTLAGDLNVAALERAWQKMLDRHPVLRTAFVWEGLDEPVQVVYSGVRIALRQQDWRDLSPEEQRERLAEHLRVERRRGFDLTEAPLMRLHLFRLADDAYRLIWSHHHLLLDGWCNTLILKEVFTFYEAFSRGREIELEPSRPFRDYIAWLQGQDLSRAEEFWRATLKGFTTPTPLSVDQLRRGGVGAQSFDEEHTLLSLEATRALQSLARRHRLTMHTVVQGAWALLLSRYSGSGDVLFGDVVAGRPAEIEGVETMMGMFINSLPVRVSVPADERLIPWLKRLQEQQIESRQYEHSPLVQAQQCSDVPQGSPLFDSLLSYQNYPVDASLRDGRGSVRIEDVHTIQTANYPITVTVTPVPELMPLVKYDCSRFDVETVRRMLGHFKTLLEGFAADPERRLDEYELLPAAERHQLLAGWNDTATDYPRERQVQELFEEQAALTPDATALVFGEQTMTYGELNARANQLAHHLRGLGVGAESLVGLCVERSAELIVGMLGILKAGGAYVPFDPSYPVERLSFMMEDAAVEALVAQERLLDEMPSFWGPVVCLDADADTLDACDAGNLAPLGGADALAYVIYTSGSTGTPKGVCVPHRGVTRLVRETSYASFGAEEVFLQLAPASFDASTFEVWGALLNGARLAVMPPRQPSLREIGEAVRAHAVTTLWLTAGLFNLMVDERAEDLRPLRQLLAGGDVLSVAHVEKFLAANPGCRLINGYGPTENTTFTCCHSIEAVEAGASVPIGRAIANTQVYVLDSRMRPVPVGVEGELYVGGDGLARGYLKRPALTAERFVPHPFSVEAGARLYRTGDRVRLLPDGAVEFLGRADFQVKVRGFRIELGEIEAVLTANRGVRDCTVVVREELGDKRLVAYFVAADEDEPVTGEELRRYLVEKLPDYMVPSRFVPMEALPLNANGKIDRRALPAPDTSRDDAEAAYLAPQTQAEEMLAGIWGDLLGVERVGAGDNFFDLGGHSLLATQVMSRIRGAFGLEIALKELFEQPTLRELARSVEEARRAGAAGAEAPPVVRVEREGLLPLSYAQQRLWFLEQLEPGSPVYNIPVALRLEGGLDAAALESSINGLIQRHETLRTTFSVVGGEPVQVVAPFAPAALPLIDLSGLTRERAEAEAAALRDAEARRGFDLSEGPLLRVMLVRLCEEEHVLLVTMHHIVSDGWSMGVLVREVAALYEAHRRGTPAELPELEVQYADYAVWQREYLSGDVLEGQLAYWKEQLAGAPPVLELPADRPRPAVQSFRGEAFTFACGPELSAALRAFSRREGVTLYMTLLAAFAALLRRYSGEEDVVVGTPIANRNRIETEGLIGFFVNTLAMRARLGGDPTFGDAVRGVREVVLGAYAHQDVPFERVVEELKPERDLSRSPVFQVMFAWQNAPAEELELEGVRISYEGARAETAKYDLGLTMWEQAGEGVLEGLFDFATDLFEAGRIRKMSAHFVEVLERLVADPEERLSTLTALPGAEVRRQLVEWNDTAAEFPRDLCIHELFEARAASEPDAPAVLCGGRSLSYGELNRRANRLARRIRRLGAGPETIVGLCLEQSPEMLTALLAVLKAGAAYLPLDPSYPSERLSFLTGDAGARILLTQQSLASKFDAKAFEHVLSLDAAADPAGREGEENLPRAASAGNLAYVIYTSGSTGLPKGVLVGHRGLVNHSTAVGRLYGLRAGDRVLQFAAPGFDVAAEEIFPTWLSGACVVLWPERHRVSFAEFQRFAEAQELTVLNLPTPYWQEWVQSLAGNRQAPPATLRVMVVGSAQGLPERFAAWREISGGVRTFNAYGPTEATITSTVCALDDSLRGDSSLAVPIGRPIANTRAYVLDERLNLVPAGSAGELCLGGVGLARGYLNQSSLTAERFIPDPFSAEPGARLYRTGDRVRYTPAGEIEFLGRADNQVKVRGHRIEPGEIEAALAQHNGVRDVVVNAADDAQGEKFLAAYVVAAQEPPTVAELRAHLRSRMPEYMVPSAFVFLESLPLTPNGKVDRRALPAPEVALTASASYDAPRTPTEELLAGLWAEVLRMEGVGIRDNFFDLGGHSLLATQVVSRVREVFGVEVALRQLFERPTIEALAEAVEEARAATSATDARGLRVRRAQREAGVGVALSFAQQRLWFLDQLEPGSGFYNVPVALRLEGSLDVSALESSLSEIVSRHESLRTRFATAAGEPVQVIDEPWLVRLEARDVSDAEVLPLAEAEAREGFDLSEGPLLRVRLLRLGEREHVLLLTMHHIISDGWSMGVLVREVAALYEAHRRGTPAELPELPVQYADYAVWQREYLSGDVLEGHLRYWKRQMAGAPPVLELPADRPRPEEQTHRGAQKAMELGVGLSEQLRALSRREGVTLYMTLLAAFDVLLHHHTRGEDIVVGTDVANRGRVEVEGLIGFFVNQLALRVRLSGDPTFRELLGRVRKVALEAYAHQDVPFDRLVDALGLGRSLKYAPLFQVKLILQNTPAAELEVPGLRLSNVEIDRGTSQLDLNLRLTEFEQAIHGSAEYSTDLFDEATVARLLRGFETILEGAVSRPDARLSELVAALAAEERRQRETRDRELKQSISHKLKNRRRAPAAAREGHDASAQESPALIG